MRFCMKVRCISFSWEVEWSHTWQWLPSHLAVFDWHWAEAATPFPTLSIYPFWCICVPSWFLWIWTFDAWCKSLGVKVELESVLLCDHSHTGLPETMNQVDYWICHSCMLTGQSLDYQDRSTDAGEVEATCQSICRARLLCYSLCKPFPPSPELGLWGVYAETVVHFLGTYCFSWQPTVWLLKWLALLINYYINY